MPRRFPVVTGTVNRVEVIDKLFNPEIFIPLMLTDIVAVPDSDTALKLRMLYPFNKAKSRG